MNNTTLILSVLMTVALAVLIAPSVFAINQGKILRNIALWLAIFTSLALVYRNFGPDSRHPLFSLPSGMVRHEPEESSRDKTDGDKTGDDQDNGSQGYTPPKE